MTAQPEGFFAAPPSGAGSGVLVLHPWWGLNDTIRDFCRRLAAEGYVVFAPDLFHGEVATTIEQAEALSGKADGARAKAEIAEAVAFLKARAERPELAVVGFSFGAYFALALSAEDSDAVRTVVIFYGTGPADFGRSKAAYLGHFAQDDPYEPLENVAELEKELRAAGRPVTFHTYPGTGHWFFEPDRIDAYNAAAAQLAWDRTLAFLREQVDSL